MTAAELTGLLRADGETAPEQLDHWATTAGAAVFALRRGRDVALR